MTLPPTRKAFIVPNSRRLAPVSTPPELEECSATILMSCPCMGVCYRGPTRRYRKLFFAARASACHTASEEPQRLARGSFILLMCAAHEAHDSSGCARLRFRLCTNCLAGADERRRTSTNATWQHSLFRTFFEVLSSASDRLSDKATETDGICLHQRL